MKTVKMIIEQARGYGRVTEPGEWLGDITDSKDIYTNLQRLASRMNPYKLICYIFRCNAQALGMPSKFTE